ncbi:MAG: hypothetical protein P8N02_05370 [Actinomycetota bacterium]|nr:hypothetical protein [Actinomycetota bacterium]
MIRRLLAAAMLFFGAAIANVCIVAWWFDREVTEPERVREIAAAVLHDPAIREELAPLVLERAGEELALDEAATAQVTDAVEATLLDPAMVSSYADTLEGLYRAVFEDSGDSGIAFDTSDVEESLLATLEGVDPRLAETVAAIDLPVSIPLSLDELPDLASLERGLSVGWRIALVVGGGLLLAGVVVHPRSMVAMRRIGLLFLTFAGLQALAVWLITDLAAPRVPIAGFESLTASAAGILLASLTAQAIVQAVAAGLLAVSAHLAIWVPRLSAPFRAVAATMGS